MTTDAILLSVATFISSVGVSMFIAGQRWGEVRSELRYMNDRLAKIEGMYTLTPVQPGQTATTTTTVHRELDGN